MRNSTLLLGLIIYISPINFSYAQYLRTDGSNNMTNTLQIEMPALYSSIELISNIGSFIDFHSSITSDFDGRIIWNFNNSRRFGIYGKTRFYNDVYFNQLVGVGLTNPEAGLHIVKANTIADGSQVAARLGNSHNHWTYFGGGNSGRIRGGSEGYLWIESNQNGTSDKRLYLNSSTPGDITMAT